MNQDRLMKVLLAPHISEKATVLAERHKQFVFRVVPDATKPEIKKAVELMFDVKVGDVRIVNTRGKATRRGPRRGRKASIKKAYVALRPGYDIDFMGPQ